MKVKLAVERIAFFRQLRCVKPFTSASSGEPFKSPSNKLYFQLWKERLRNHGHQRERAMIQMGIQSGLRTKPLPWPLRDAVTMNWLKTTWENWLSNNIPPTTQYSSVFSLGTGPPNSTEIQGTQAENAIPLGGDQANSHLLSGNGSVWSDCLRISKLKSAQKKQKC